MIHADEIIKMSAQAGFTEVFLSWPSVPDKLTAFAALVSARAAKDEREKNAIRCDAISNRYNKPDEAGYRIAAEWCAAEIRSAK